MAIRARRRELEAGDGSNQTGSGEGSYLERAAPGLWLISLIPTV